jgi:hypothetical protein
VFWGVFFVFGLKKCFDLTCENGFCVLKSVLYFKLFGNVFVLRTENKNTNKYGPIFLATVSFFIFVFPIQIKIFLLFTLVHSLQLFMIAAS